MEIKDKYIGNWVVGDKLWAQYSDNQNIDINIDKRMFVYIEDRYLIKNHMFIGLCYCLDKWGEFYILQKEELKIRVKEEAIVKIIPQKSTFFWGDNVQEVNRPQIIGVIEKIEWHYKEQKYFYYISINGKMKSRRYYDEDLEKTK